MRRLMTNRIDDGSWAMGEAHYPLLAIAIIAALVGLI
jgi:hypothetical protein